MRAQLTQQMERQAAEEPLALAIDELADAALKLTLNVASEAEKVPQDDPRTISTCGMCRRRSTASSRR